MQLKGAHIKLKHFLTVFNKDLYDVIQNIKNFIKNNINYYTITIAKQKNRLLHDIHKPKFKNIFTKMMPFYLHHFKDQLWLVKSANYQPNYNS